jgi:hypothetical protein
MKIMKTGMKITFFFFVKSNEEGFDLIVDYIGIFSKLRIDVQQ